MILRKVWIYQTGESEAVHRKEIDIIMAKRTNNDLQNTKQNIKGWAIRTTQKTGINQDSILIINIENAFNFLALLFCCTSYGKWAFPLLYDGENTLFFDKIMMPTFVAPDQHLLYILFLVRCHWNNSSLIDMSLHRTDISWFQVISFRLAWEKELGYFV